MLITLVMPMHTVNRLQATHANMEARPTCILLVRERVNNIHKHVHSTHGPHPVVHLERQTPQPAVLQGVHAIQPPPRCSTHSHHHTAPGWEWGCMCIVSLQYGSCLGMGHALVRHLKCHFIHLRNAACGSHITRKACRCRVYGSTTPYGSTCTIIPSQASVLLKTEQK